MNAPRTPPEMVVQLTVGELEELMERAVSRALDARAGVPAAEPPSEWLDPKAAAELLRIHVRTVRLYAEKGKLPFVKVGKSYRFRRAELVAWLEASRGRGPGVESGAR